MSGNQGLGVKIKVGVKSECGHDWTETRPAGVTAPVNGELRACGHPDCYPAQFPVRYSEPIEWHPSSGSGGNG